MYFAEQKCAPSSAALGHFGTVFEFESQYMLQHVNNAQEHHDLPAWFDEVGAALAYSDHIVLSGNVGDLYPSPVMSQSAFKGLNETLWEILKAAGFEAMLAFDPVGGLQIISASG
jgi:hypothetical protein